MATTDGKLEWVLRLESRELWLICSALSGRLSAENAAEARTLSDTIQRNRANQSRNLLKAADAAMRHLGEAPSDPSLAIPPSPMERLDASAERVARRRD